MGLSKITAQSLISANERPASSPDCNPLDYAIWEMLEPVVNAKQHRSVDAVKRKLKEDWKKLPLTKIRKSIEVWRNRLQCVVSANGGRFE